MTVTEDEVAEEYERSLAELSCNSKPKIDMLTMLAEENENFAARIVQITESRITQVPNDKKLPILYLIDSIVKNCPKTSYKILFQKKLVDIFLHVYERGEEKTRQSMYCLRLTWNEHFPKSKLYNIDIKVNSVDRAWPIANTTLGGAAKSKEGVNIHVNPKFINSANSMVLVSETSNFPKSAKLLPPVFRVVYPQPGSATHEYNVTSIKDCLPNLLADCMRDLATLVGNINTAKPSDQVIGEIVDRVAKVTLLRDEGCEEAKNTFNLSSFCEKRKSGSFCFSLNGERFFSENPTPQNGIVNKLTQEEKEKVEKKFVDYWKSVKVGGMKHTCQLMAEINRYLHLQSMEKFMIGKTSMDKKGHLHDGMANRMSEKYKKKKYTHMIGLVLLDGAMKYAEDTVLGLEGYLHNIFRDTPGFDTGKKTKNKQNTSYHTQGFNKDQSTSSASGKKTKKKPETYYFVLYLALKLIAAETVTVTETESETESETEPEAKHNAELKSGPKKRLNFEINSDPEAANSD